MKNSRIALCAALGIVLLGSSTVAFGEDASSKTPNESTALFTFFTDTTTTQVVNDGPMRVIDRTGTLTIYQDSAPNGSFANRNTFRDGKPLLVADLH